MRSQPRYVGIHRDPNKIKWWEHTAAAGVCVMVILLGMATPFIIFYFVG